MTSHRPSVLWVTYLALFIKVAVDYWVFTYKPPEFVIFAPLLASMFLTSVLLLEIVRLQRRIERGS